MSATITSQFRKNNAIALITEAEALATANTTGTGNGYWIGIGKSDPWEGTNEATIELPGSNPRSSADALGNLITLRKVIDSSSTIDNKPALVYPANQWMSGRIYKVYDPTEDLCYYSTEISGSTHYPCYVHSGLKVYLCLARTTAGATTSTVDPNSSTGASAAVGATFSVNDNYTWVYLYTLTTASPFNTSTFKAIPATHTQSGITGALGMCFSMRIVNGGSGYSGTPTVTMYASDADGATVTPVLTQVTVTISGDGVITHIAFTCTTTSMKRASVTITGGGTGTGAIVIPLLTPIGGAASNLRDILPCWYAAFYAKFDPSDTDNNASTYPDLVNTISYRQVSLIRNPTRTYPAVNDSTNTPNSMDCLRYLTVITTTAGLPAVFTSQIITQGATKAYLDYITLSPDKRVYYHQNSNTAINLAGFNTAQITIPGTGTLQGTVALGASEYLHGSGEVLFLENRQSITRNANQSEEIKLIIQL